MSPTQKSTMSGYSLVTLVIVIGVLLIFSLQFFKINTGSSLPQTTDSLVGSGSPTSQNGTTVNAVSTTSTTINSIALDTSSNTVITKKLSAKPRPVVELTPQNNQPVSATTVEVTSTDPTPLLNLSTLNTMGRHSLVNIFCITNNDGGIRPITGSGMIIDERGVILTNAHIGQYILLQSTLSKGTIRCTIRTDSPARDSYNARLIYLSSNWIQNNYANIISTNPTGTGEDDFALLYITGSSGVDKTLPEHFPAVSIDTSDTVIKLGDQVLALGYPAGFLGGVTITQDLYAATSVATVHDMFTFKKDTFDLFSIGGSVVAQKGSSGGGVINQINGKISGLIVTTSDDAATGDRDLRAITLGHIDRSLHAQEGVGINEFLQGNLESKVLSFYENKATALAQILVDVISRKK